MYNDWPWKMDSGNVLTENWLVHNIVPYCLQFFINSSLMQ